MNTNVKNGQSLFDIALQTCGNAESAFDLALMNGLAVSDELIVGTELNITATENIEVAAVYIKEKQFPATAVNNEQELVLIEQNGDFDYETTIDHVFVSVVDNTISVKNGQSLLDIAMSNNGYAETAFYLALQNDLSLSDNLTPGQKLEPVSITKEKIVAVYKASEVIPATSITSEQESELLPFDYEGVGYWGIEFDFVIS